MSISKLAALACGLGALGAGAAQGAILVNGDFEGPTPAYGLPIGWDGSHAVNGGPLNNPNLFVASGADYVPCCGTFGSPASLANHFATFGAGDTTHAGGLLAQSFATTAGQGYLLNFGVAAFGVAGSQTLRVRVFDLSTPGLNLDTTATVASNNNLDTAFVGQSFTFTATGALSRLRYENISAVTANIDAAIDSVSIAAVPEPSAWALMIAGFGLAGTILRRRPGRALARFR